MIRSFDGKTPRIAKSAFVSEWAYIVGDVDIGEHSSVWPGAVIRGDFGSVRIGNNSHIEDNAVLHVWDYLEIGDNVTIGHSAVIHCLKIGNGVLVGINATVLDDAEIGDNCIIAANSMVSTGRKIPGNSFVAGVPARIKRGFSSDEIYLRMRDRYSKSKRQEAHQLSYTDLAGKYMEQGL